MSLASGGAKAGTGLTQAPRVQVIMMPARVGGFTSRAIHEVTRCTAGAVGVDIRAKPREQRGVIGVVGIEWVRRPACSQ